MRTAALPGNGAAAGALAILASVTGGGQAFPWSGAACAMAIVAAGGMFVSPLLAKLMAVVLMPVVAGWLVGRLAPRLLPVRLHANWVVAWACAGSALFLGLSGAAQLYRYGFTPAELVAFTRLEILALPALAWCGALALPLVVLQRQAYRDELAALRLAAVNAELKALQAQVEPHFLYNTLANTRYLARHQPQRAVEMLDHLIAYLHQALPDMRSRSSTVRRECGLAGHYLALMAIRFGERLRYTVDVADDVADAEMPPLLLISLVENAVRHGVEPMPGTVTIAVRAARVGEQLRLTVVDDGPGPQARSATGNGVGLRNAADRLRTLHGAAASLALTRGSDQRTCAEIVLPLQRPTYPIP